nr:MAG TPA: hypothetical protein [Caudoviricetes sp.]
MIPYNSSRMLKASYRVFGSVPVNSICLTVLITFILYCLLF